MSLETKQTLDDATVEKLQKLIRANIDAYDGFNEAAEEVDETQLASLFRQIASDRSEFASDLQEYVEWNGEEAEDDGSVAASVHRVWINIRGKINGGDPYVILAEAERGEDSIKESYEEVLKKTSGSAMNDVLMAQYRVVKAGHDKIRNLRDQYKAKK